jgi:hypothetical protein
MPRPHPRPPLPQELLAHPRRSAAWQASGVGRQELRGPLWTPVLRGLHAWLPPDVTDPATRIEAVISLMPTGAALGGWAALRWLGVTALDGRTGAGGSRLVPITVCVGPVGRVRKRAGLDVDRSTLLRVDTTVHRGGRVTTPERSCLDVMRRFGAEEGLVPGVPQARLAVPFVDGAAESGPESRLRYVWVVEAGLPGSLVNPTVVTLDGAFVGRTDLLDPEAGTVAEYDGGHHRDLTRHTADNVREEDLEHLNLTVTRSTALDLWPHRPRLVLGLRTAHRDGCRRDRSRDAWGIRLP